MANCKILDEFSVNFRKEGGFISDPKNVVAFLFGNFEGKKRRRAAISG